MLTLDEELERLNDRAMDLIDEYKDLDESYIDDERAYMERKAYLDEKKENLKGLFDSYHKRVERGKAYIEDLKKNESNFYKSISVMSCYRDQLAVLPMKKSII